ncbi:N-acetyltransferase [Robertmurraya siralis]|uniref:N-acetyltransferase n=1 Tax=Robertmurraya siralis TaxID=77777 RepID=A0A920BTS7_9BACI|nr:GNAT family N-acetyltransferase [Robertmurraya siralis]PAE18502.1 GNAT family N-acetyltransferase [Bacillus sp. 7504-2]GIN61911.1 N-acetyltransferase [Robertmurraya siralis]
MGWDAPFMKFPIIETKRLILRNLHCHDAHGIYSYLSKKEVMKYYDREQLSSLQEAEELIDSLLFRYQSRNQIRWGITLKGENEIIGTCGFHSLEEEHLKGEIGYDLNPAYWGKGIMSEAVRALVEYGFSEMNFNRIEALYSPFNYGSKKVLEKNGFKEEGILRKRFFIQGKYMDAVLCAVLQEDKRGAI